MMNDELGISCFSFIIHHYLSVTLTERLALKRPKRLLSIDGGGIRGLIAAEILVKIEDLLCRPNSRWHCLADYFDFIGGTSTGAILSAGLALGMSARELRDFYVRLGPGVFQKRWLLGQLWSKYKAGPLEKQLQYLFGEATLGLEPLKTLLMIVTKNASTGDPWFFVNSPRNPFAETNSKIPLWQLVRASSAAPTFFPPYTLTLGDGKKFEFIDGGVSMFNNPSFQLFLEATVPEYSAGWDAGVDKVLLISVGTGFKPEKIAKDRARSYTLFHWASYVVNVLMDDANVQQNILMKLISHTPKSEWLDRELEDFVVPTTKAIEHLQLNAPRSNVRSAKAFNTRAVAFATKMLTYHRYTTALTRERFNALNLPSKIDPRAVEDMDCIDQIDELRAIGRAVAEEQVSIEDFKGFLHKDE
jgi:predicted acylesterase/phospholipase RssA